MTTQSIQFFSGNIQFAAPKPKTPKVEKTEEGSSIGKWFSNVFSFNKAKEAKAAEQAAKVEKDAVVNMVDETIKTTAVVDLLIAGFGVLRGELAVADLTINQKADLTAAGVINAATGEIIPKTEEEIAAAIASYQNILHPAQEAETEPARFAVGSEEFFKVFQDVTEGQLTDRAIMGHFYFGKAIMIVLTIAMLEALTLGALYLVAALTGSLIAASIAAVLVFLGCVWVIEADAGGVVSRVGGAIINTTMKVSMAIHLKLKSWFGKK